MGSQVQILDYALRHRRPLCASLGCGLYILRSALLITISTLLNIFVQLAFDVEVGRPREPNTP